MTKKRFLPVLFLLVLVSSTVALLPTPAHAISFEEIITGVKSFIPGAEKNKSTNEIKMESSIALAPNGDMDKNSAIDSGDIVRFTYKIVNKTDREYKLATLKTNIQSKQLNFIHNIRGTVNLNDRNDTVTIPNFRLAPHQISTISFDARINYTSDKDPVVSTEAELVDSENKSVVKSAKKEVKANRLNEDKLQNIKQQILNRFNKSE